ncbi:hypothetical protein BD410DRAFT_130287 [Rickenella mellea]|uniref:Protein kinase domain-containing protein n=1 Tax=Rickenella mellea TaxID=50990 RepID=A0A4Y7QA40_9AGAM|nr:hypothetical protein BD410DRAFT_130287 [Rickenella mellea]
MNANRVFLAGLDKTLERLSRQFAVWSTLNHPNVARLLGKTTHTRDSELFWGVPCIISRWYEGRTLARYVTKTKRNDPLGYFYGRADAMIERLELVGPLLSPFHCLLV